MIIDTSALLAIFFAEPERDDFLRILATAESTSMSAATYAEAGIVADCRAEPVVSRRLDELIETLRMEIVPLTAKQAGIAREAYRDFGRGSGHPAKLNYGDCFSYALAKDTGEPLLWKGDDFGHTDVRRPHAATGS